MKKISIKLFLALAFCILMSGIKAQELDANRVKKAVETKNFVFRAHTVYPMGAPSKYLTPGYDLRLSGDSAVVYLPYFGRAYTAPRPGEGAIRFTSTDFTYKTKQKKKKSWEVVIDPRDTDDVRQLVLRIFENGNATLMVSSNGRQSISFSGSISIKE